MKYISKTTGLNEVIIQDSLWTSGAVLTTKEEGSQQRNIMGLWSKTLMHYSYWEGGNEMNYYIRYTDFRNSIGVSCCYGHSITLISKKDFAGSMAESNMGLDKFKCSQCENKGIIKGERRSK